MSKTCGYKTIAETFRAQIRSGVRQPGEALPPERALSQSLGVERATVRRALAVLAEEGWIATRPGVGSVVKGVPGASGAPVAFIVASPAGGDAISGHHFVGPVYRAFAGLCRADGLRCVQMTVLPDEDGSGLRPLLAQCAGVILAECVSDALAETVRAAGIPCVLMSTRRHGFRTVLCDNEGGIADAVAALAAHGHTTIGYIGGTGAFWNQRARLTGFRHAMTAQSLSPDCCVPDSGSWGASGGEAAMASLLRKFPEMTAAVTANHALAVGAARAAQAADRRCAIIGFGSPDGICVSHDGVARELYRALCCERDAPYRDAATVLCEAVCVYGAAEKTKG